MEKPKKAAHMAKRKPHVTYRQLAGEFGTSPSTAHRKVKMVRDGLSSRESAK